MTIHTINHSLCTCFISYVTITYHSLHVSSSHVSMFLTFLSPYVLLSIHIHIYIHVPKPATVHTYLVYICAHLHACFKVPPLYACQYLHTLPCLYTCFHTYHHYTHVIVFVHIPVSTHVTIIFTCPGLHTCHHYTNVPVSIYPSYSHAASCGHCVPTGPTL